MTNSINSTNEAAERLRQSLKQICDNHGLDFEKLDFLISCEKDKNLLKKRVKIQDKIDEIVSLNKGTTKW